MEWRAGTASDCNSGLNFDGEGFSHLARFSENSACGASGDYAYNSVSVYAYTSAQGGSAIVGSYRPNAWGLYDMHGNLAEICLDYYQADVSAQTGADPWGPELPQGTTSSNDRVGKGGCYYLDYRYLAPSQRMKVAPSSATPHIGARICLTVF
jgi:formylglycine-generating enzyme required for sulfatase activity